VRRVVLKADLKSGGARWIVALLAIAALAVAGCGSDSDSGSNPSDSSPSASGGLDVPDRTIGYIDVLKRGAFQNDAATPRSNDERIEASGE
jgi:hypothetical protein